MIKIYSKLIKSYRILDIGLIAVVVIIICLCRMSHIQSKYSDINVFFPLVLYFKLPIRAKGFRHKPLNLCSRIHLGDESRKRKHSLISFIDTLCFVEMI